MPQSQTVLVSNLLRCPECGNDQEFVEVSPEVTTTTFYQQNPDGSFTPVNQESEQTGSPRLYCGNCEKDLSALYERFAEMIF
ncbi:MAG: hypothetical protein LBH14_02835 [Desulfobulbaceae bacterium]|jgi:hypothetical protein|nr:hypothetical protein [Desulfobulbaceae bacterium]